MADDVTLTESGDLVIAARRLGTLGKIQPNQIRLLKMRDDLLISAQPQPGLRSRPLLYGDLRLFHVAELLALVSSMRKDGILALLLAGADKTIFFAGGEVVFAASTVEDDRLGEVMIRRGRLSLKQFSELQKLVTPDKRFGALAVEQGLLTPHQLYDAIKEQVLEIVWSTFHCSKGEFLFIEGRPEVRNLVRLDVATRDIIREGVRRVEQMSRLEELFRDRDTIVISRPVQVDVTFDEKTERIRSLIDGQKTVAQLICESHLSEYDALDSLAQLRSAGLVDLHDGQPVGEVPKTGQPDPLQAWLLMLRRIHQTLKVEDPGSEKRLGDYLALPAPKIAAVFAGSSFDDDGRLDLDQLLNRLDGTDVENRQQVYEALSTFYDYACFQAMDVLDDDLCDGLMQQLERIKEKLKSGEDPAE